MTRKKLSGILPISIMLATVSLYLNCINPREKIQKKTRFVMDTYCTIQVQGNHQAGKAIEKAFERIEEIDKKFNVLNMTSILYHFNQRNTPITDKEIIGLIETAINISKESNGAFDITVYPLMECWGFYNESHILPEKEKIKKCLKTVGYQNLQIKNMQLTKANNSVKIDLGGIAKGYAIREAVNVLKSEGIKSALIDAGGDIYALGTLKKRKWGIGIRNPRGDGIIGAIKVNDTAVVTSGDYERYFERDGIRYHHILNPKTGYPSRELASVTVLAPDPVLADAWSTALFVMGKEKGLELAEKLQEIETFMVTADGQEICSSGLKDVIENIE